MDTESFLLKRQDLQERMREKRAYRMPRWSRLVYGFLSSLGISQLFSGVFMPVAGSFFLNRFGRRPWEFFSKKPFLSRIFELVSFLKA